MKTNALEQELILLLRDGSDHGWLYSLGLSGQADVTGYFCGVSVRPYAKNENMAASCVAPTAIEALVVALRKAKPTGKRETDRFEDLL